MGRGALQYALQCCELAMATLTSPRDLVQCLFQLTKVLIFLTQINCTVAAITMLVMVEIEESHDRNANISLICENIFTEHEAGKADKGEIICWSSQSCERRRPIMLLSVGTNHRLRKKI